MATFVTNDVVNSLGIAWAWQMMAETGAEAAEVVRAYWIAREVTGAVSRWEEVEALFADPAVDTEVQMEVMVGVDGLVEGVSRWYLQHANDGDAAGVIARDRASFSELAQTLRGVGSDAWRADHALQREALAARGLPLSLAEAAAWRSELTYAPDVIAAARATGCSLAEAADAFFALGERLHLDWLEEQIGAIAGRDALAALGAGRGARRVARDAARADRAGHRRREGRSHGRGRHALPGRAVPGAGPRSAPRREFASRRHGRYRGRYGRRSPGQERLRMSTNEQLDLNRAALLMIDVQREYFAEGGPLRIPDGPMVLARLRDLLEDYREANMPIVHIRHEEAPGAPVFAADGKLIETMPEVVPRHIEPVVTKHSPGAFTETELSAVLVQQAARTVVIAGFMTHMCCDTTARQAQERGLNVIFLTDGTATRNLTLGDRTVGYLDVQAATLAAQADGFARLADVATVRAVLADGMGY